MIMASIVSRRSAEAAAAALYACETRLLGMFEHDDSLARCALRGGGFPKTTIVWPDATQRWRRTRGGTFQRTIREATARATVPDARGEVPRSHRCFFWVLPGKKGPVAFPPPLAFDRALRPWLRPAWLQLRPAWLRPSCPPSPCLLAYPPLVLPLELVLCAPARRGA